MAFCLAAPPWVAAGDLITERQLPPWMFGKSFSTETSLTPNLSVSSGAANNVLSQPPVLMGRYTVNGQTLLPYIGAGFGGGEPTDANRTIMQEDRLLRDPLSKSLMPNEFQLGLRIPF